MGGGWGYMCIYGIEGGGSGGGRETMTEDLHALGSDVVSQPAAKHVIVAIFQLSL